VTYDRNEVLLIFSPRAFAEQKGSRATPALQHYKSPDNVCAFSSSISHAFLNISFGASAP
jgi:hypothetical protein